MLQGRPDDDLDVVAKPREHPRQLIEGTRRGHRGDNARSADRLARQGSPSRVQRAAAVGLLRFAGFVMLKPLHLQSLDATIIGPECHARCGNDAFVVAIRRPEAKLRYN
jgi:hypothetical protein